MDKFYTTVDCYLISYDVDASSNEEMRTVIWESFNQEGSKNFLNDYKLSESCYLIPNRIDRDILFDRISKVTSNDILIHIIELEIGKMFYASKKWGDSASIQIGDICQRFDRKD